MIQPCLIDTGVQQIAADGAYDHCRAQGIAIDWVVGDGDSRTKCLSEHTQLHHFDDQDTTDFEKCLDFINTRDLFL